MAERKKNPLIKERLGKPRDLDLTNLPEKVKQFMAEPKLDGLRGNITLKANGSCGAYSSNGCLVPNARYICRKVANALPNQEIVLDGEFFCKDWNITQSIVMSQKKHPKAKELRLRAFDAMSLHHWMSKTSETLRSRKIFLKGLIKKIHSSHIVWLPYEMVANSPGALTAFYKRMIKEGHEGAMFKDPDAPYPFKRSKVWLRWKPKKTIDCEVVGTRPGNGKFLGLIGSLQCEFKSLGKRITFNASGMTDDKRKMLTKLSKQGKLLGRIVEIEHEGITVHNKVRFPQFCRLRPDRDA